MTVKDFHIGCKKGKEYVIQINDPEEIVSFEIYIYDADQNIVFPALASTRTNQTFSIPDEAYGILIRFHSWEGKTIDTTLFSFRSIDDI